MLAAQQQKEAAKETKRKKYVATGPARQSTRAGAKRTRAKLQQQAQDSAESSDNEQSVSSASQESQGAGDSMAESGLSKLLQKRKRGAQEVDFDPAGLSRQLPVEKSFCPCYSTKYQLLSQISQGYCSLQTLPASHHLRLMKKIQTGRMMRTSCLVHCKW